MNADELCGFDREEADLDARLPSPTLLPAMRIIQQHRLDGPRHSHRGMIGAVLALGFAGVGWLLAGCVPTAVQPFYRAADVIHDPALLGVWKDKPDGKDHWTFTPGEGKSYTVEIRSDDQKTAFTAHLFKLGNERFLDLYPPQSGLEEKLQKNPYAAALIPGHLFVRVRATEPALRMSSMGLDWLKQELKRDPKAIDHVILSEDRVVFTGRTEAMQAFITQHVNTADAWNEMYGDGLVKVGGKPGVK